MRRPPIRGRRPELRAIARRLDLLSQGRGGCLLIDGAPGMGTTRLLAETADLARDRKLAVAGAACDELDRHVPMSPLLTALRAGPDPVLPVSEPDRAATEADRRFWFLERLRDVLAQRSRRTPLVVTLDDLQWADATTLTALRVLCSRTGTAAVLWAFAYHSGQASADVHRVLDGLPSRDATRLSLAALDRDDALAYAADLLGRAPSPETRRIVAGAHGDPFLISALLRPAAPGDGPGVPARLAGHVRHRLRGAPPDARRLLEVGAVLGRSFRLDDAARLLARPAGRVIGALEAALATGLIVAERDHLAFRHDLVRRAIYDDLPGAVRTGLRLEAHRLPPGAGGAADEPADRTGANGTPPDAAAAIRASRAAYYEGRVAEALTTARSAVRMASGEPAAGRRPPGLWLARMLRAGDRPAEVEAVCRDGERVAAETGDAWSRPCWRLCRARGHVECGRLTEAARDAEECRSAAEGLGLAAPAAEALGVLGLVAFHRGDIAEAQRCARLAAPASDGLPPDPGSGWIEALLADALGRPGDALDIEFATDGVAGRDRLARLLEVGVTAIPYVTRIAVRAGRESEARDLMRQARRLAEANPGMETMSGVAAHVEGIVRGDPDALARAAAAYQETGRRLAAAMAAEDLGRALLHVGDRAAAVARLRAALRTVGEIGAFRHADRIRRVLRGEGVRHRFNSPRRPVTFGWGSLTDAELRVATLAAEGLTTRAIADRLFLSPHTINTHLRHVFRKLGVNSRVALTRVLLTETPSAAHAG